MQEAMFYTQEENNRVRCGLCRSRCLISDDGCGICNVRENHGGILYSRVYGKICAEHVDPIEKKPLFHFLPGSSSYSIASSGCNFRCRFCQNYEISQIEQNAPIPGDERSPRQIVQRAIATGCRSISYTYTEPTIFYEFAYKTARLAKEAGLRNVFVTNGYISREALALIAPYLDAANIDLKSFSEKFYRDMVHARLSEVLDSIVEYRKHGIWIELTTLIIPKLNDAEPELKGIAEFIVSNLGVDTPWHVTRFYPTYLLTDYPKTPVSTLKKARDIGFAAGLRHVYDGNVPGSGGENTICPSCGELLIKRYGFMIDSNRIGNGECPDCGTTIAGIFR